MTARVAIFAWAAHIAALFALLQLANAGPSNLRQLPNVDSITNGPAVFLLPSTTPTANKQAVFDSNGRLASFAGSLTGATGATGSSGSTGSTGQTGLSGSSGASGSSGSTGQTGNSGQTGASGQSGASGASGSTGQTGQTGQSGFTGFTGFTGYTGFTGTTGAAGLTGASGSTGGTGGTGATGATGSIDTSNFSFTVITGSNLTTSSNVLGNATGLSFAVAANETWHFSVQMNVGIDNTGGVKFALTFPSGGTAKGQWDGTNTGSTTFRNELIQGSGTTTSAFVNLTSTNGNSYVRIVEGTYVNGSTSGTVQVQFAAGVNTQTATIFTGSHINASKL